MSQGVGFAPDENPVMKLVESSASRLVYEDSPEVFASRVGALGCALPLLLVGAQIATAVKDGRVIHVHNAFWASVTLAAGVYVLSRCREFFHTGSATHRLTIGGTVLDERFDTSGALKDSREFEARQIVATFRPTTGKGRGPGRGTYKVELRQENGPGIWVDHASSGRELLTLLLKIQSALKRPILIEGLKNELRPALNVARTTQLPESYHMGEDGKTLEVDFSSSQRRLVAERRRAYISVAVLIVLYFAASLSLTGNLGFAWGLGLAVFPLLLLRNSYTAEPPFCILRLNDGRISLSADGRAYEQPVSALRDIVVLARGLHFVFDDEVYSFLAESPNQAELSYLYSVIAQTLKAQGRRMPTEGNGIGPQEPAQA